MFYRFPRGTVVVGRMRYRRPYEDPISVRAGEAVRPTPDQGEATDIVGWVWCTGPDGRAGWTPEAWLERRGDDWVIRQDFSALELDVEPGDRFDVLYGESGFLFVENGRGERGWVPDGAVALAEG